MYLLSTYGSGSSKSAPPPSPPPLNSRTLPVFPKFDSICQVVRVNYSSFISSGTSTHLHLCQVNCKQTRESVNNYIKNKVSEYRVRAVAQISLANHANIQLGIKLVFNAAHLAFWRNYCFSFTFY